MTEIGPEQPTMRLRRGRYIRPDSHLHGEYACVSIESYNTVFAQFHNINTGKSFGWWKFPRSDWSIDERTDDS